MLVERKSKSIKENIRKKGSRIIPVNKCSQEGYKSTSSRALRAKRTKDKVIFKSLKKKNFKSTEAI